MSSTKTPRQTKAQKGATLGQEKSTSARSWKQDGALIFFVVLSVYLFIALFSYSPNDDAWSSAGSNQIIENAAGLVGAYISDALLHLFGLLAFLLPVLTTLKIIQIFAKKETNTESKTWIARLIGLLLITVSLSALLDLSVLIIDFLPASTGGVLGSAVAELFVSFFNIIGSGLLLAAVLAVGLMLFIEFSWLAVFEKVGGGILKLVSGAQNSAQDKLQERKELALKKAEEKKAEEDRVEKEKLEEKKEPEILMPSFSDDENAQEESKASLFSKVLESSKEALRDAKDSIKSTKDEPAVTDENPISLFDEPVGQAPVKAPVSSAATTPVQKDVKIEPLEKRKVKQSEKAKRDLQGSLFKGDDVLPSLTLLEPEDKNAKHGFSKERLKDLSVLLEQKLADFGVKAEVVAVAPGPVITRFEIQPAPGTKASKVSNIAQDLARSMAMTSVRVVEVIPGKTVMGIEIPNEDRAMVRLSQIISSEDFDKSKSPLTVSLGHDIGGNPIVADVAKMPHLLVAGTTGSGKSVGVNTMLISLLYKSTPDDLRLILVDPKMLELSIYEGIPHLLTPVITDMKEAANGLRWSVEEMERRYQLMAAMGVRNIAGYNKKIRDAMEKGEYINDPTWQIDQSFDTTPPTLEPLPYIVVVIDEFADMMMVVGKKVEELIARIAQKARAAGIHLILATQRPSVDVITGLIKANVPTRIAFQVSSKIDSRTVLDQGGAEQLLGHGDMLFMPPGTSLPIRVHGAFVDDDEVHRVVADWKEKGEPNYIEEITQGGAEGGPSLEAGDEQDDLYDQAVAFVTETRKVSISSVQRKLRVGYNRAARIVETMEATGVVSPAGHNGQREVIAPPPVK